MSKKIRKIIPGQNYRMRRIIAIDSTIFKAKRQRDHSSVDVHHVNTLQTTLYGVAIDHTIECEMLKHLSRRVFTFAGLRWLFKRYCCVRSKLKFKDCHWRRMSQKSGRGAKPGLPGSIHRFSKKNLAGG